MSEIKNKKVQSDFQHTGIGIFPSDWSINQLVDVAENNGLVRGPFGGALKKNSFVKKGFKVYEQRNAIYSSVDIGRYYISASKFQELSRFSVNSGEFIVSCSGTIGKIYQIPKNAPKGIINQALLKIKLNSLIEPRYFYQVFNSDSFQDRITDSTQGGAMKNLIGMSEFKKSIIPLPSLQEQTAIATALSDVDNLIQSLEKLIAKKEAIKTGTMQQLFTGKTRLPEFADRKDGSAKEFKQTELGRIPEDWDYKALSEMTENKGLVRGPFGGALKKDSFVRTGFKVYEQRNAIYANTETGKYYIDKDKFNELQRFTVKPKDFIVSCSGTIGRIYQIPVNAPEGIINQALLKITLSKNTDEHFFYQIFNSKDFQESIIDSTQGGAMKNLIGMSEFKKSVMLMPPKTEQTAIATILSDMDTEIQALQERLEKTKDIKQGMIQQLLTGKVRLAH